jgi:hypothetical protein
MGNSRCGTEIAKSFSTATATTKAADVLLTRLPAVTGSLVCLLRGLLGVPTAPLQRQAKLVHRDARRLCLLAAAHQHRCLGWFFVDGKKR